MGNRVELVVLENLKKEKWIIELNKVRFQVKNKENHTDTHTLQTILKKISAKKINLIKRKRNESERARERVCEKKEKRNRNRNIHKFIANPSVNWTLVCAIEFYTHRVTFRIENFTTWFDEKKVNIQCVYVLLLFIYWCALFCFNYWSLNLPFFTLALLLLLFLLSSSFFSVAHCVYCHVFFLSKFVWWVS